MKRINQFGRHDANDPAMPSFTGDDEHGSGSDLGVSLDQLLGLRDDLGFFLLTADVLGVELLSESTGVLRQRLVRGQEEPSSNIRTAHAPSGVDPRRELESDVIAVDLLTGQATHVEQ